MSYNGHKNWNHWNVSLWLNNDEGLYREMVAACRSGNRDRAVEHMMAILPETTPDGAPYSKSSVRAAMTGL